jgi:hypothetical protein
VLCTYACICLVPVRGPVASRACRCRCAVVVLSLPSSSAVFSVHGPLSAVPRPLCGDAPPRWPVGFVSQLLLLPFRFLLCSLFVSGGCFQLRRLHHSFILLGGCPGRRLEGYSCNTHSHTIPLLHHTRLYVGLVGKDS